MRTTIDLPDELFRRVKARAALRGLKLKEYVEAALRESLLVGATGEEIRESAAAYGEEVLVLDERHSLPLITGPTSEVMRSLTEETIDEILE